MTSKASTSKPVIAGPPEPDGAVQLTDSTPLTPTTPETVGALGSVGSTGVQDAVSPCELTDVPTATQDVMSAQLTAVNQFWDSPTPLTITGVVQDQTPADSVAEAYSGPELGPEPEFWPGIDDAMPTAAQNETVGQVTLDSCEYEELVPPISDGVDQVQLPPEPVPSETIALRAPSWPVATQDVTLAQLTLSNSPPELGMMMAGVDQFQVPPEFVATEVIGSATLVAWPTATQVVALAQLTAENEPVAPMD